MAKPKRFHLVIAFDPLDMRWRPVMRTFVVKRAELMFGAFLHFGVFTQWYTSQDGADIEDVEAVEALCAALPPVPLFDVFSAHADLADHAFVLGGGKWFRVPPEGGKRAKPAKGGTLH